MSTLAPNPAYGAGLPWAWTVQNALSAGNGGGNQSLVNGGSAPVNGMGFSSPSRNGLSAWSFDPLMAVAGATALVTGQQYATQFYWPGGQMSKLWVYANSAATTTTHGWLAVYDASGTQWAATADQTTSAFKTTGAVSVAVASAPVPVPSGWYYGYMAAVFSAGTLEVAGHFGVVNHATAADASVAQNVNESAAPYEFNVNTTTVTALPSTLAWGTGWATDSAIGMWFGAS